jgi:SAM-dependent methyltransferase
MSHVDIIRTWTTSSVDEQIMEDGHGPLWERLIELVTEPSLAGARVLDYGCNQGGFLRLLHDRKGFREAVGCDIAAESIAVAQARAGDRPIRYVVGSDLAPELEPFDVAFSHEVIYLLPDIEAHARAIHACLKPGGVYYAVTGCHTDNPEWASWSQEIRARSNVPPVDRGLDAYAAAFAAAGFMVSARKFGLDSFLPVTRRGEITRNILARLNYYDSVKVCFRLVKGR